MKYHQVLTGMILAAATASQAFAQETAPGPAANQGDASSAQGIEDIVVVAQKRSERLQDVPIAITAVTSQTLEKANIDDVYDLGQSVAGLVASQNNTVGSLVAMIRGVGSIVGSAGYENSVALYLDGVYAASTDGAMLRLNNIERIEVLKGPQGTLFGRNATGGVINIITRDPGQEFSGNASLGYDSYRTIKANAYGTTGLGRNVAIDLGLSFMSQGKAYGHNFANDTDYQKANYEFAARSKLLITPTESTKIRIIGDYERSKSTRGFPVPVPESPLHGAFVQPVPGRFDANADGAVPRRNHGGGISAQIEQEIGDLKLVDIAAYRTQRTSAGLDADASPLPIQVINVTQFQRQFTNELRLESPSGRDLTWVVGAYYFRFNSSYDPITVGLGPIFAPLPTSVAQVRFDAGQLTKSYAGFGQASLRIGGGTTFTAGLRYSSDKPRRYGTQRITLNNGTSFLGAAGIANLPASARFKKLTWRLSLDHKFNERVMAYASFNRGFKGGGFNPNNVDDKIPYKPETLDAYEIGVKSDPVPGVLRVNLAAYYYDYKNPQFAVISNGVNYTRNAPKATIYGIDADANIVPAQNLRIDLSLAWNHARFGTFLQGPIFIGCPVGVARPCAGDISGNHLPTVADWTVTGSVNYTIPLANGGSIELNGNASFQSKTSHDAAATYVVPAFETVKASITWHLPDDQFFIRAYVDNLTNDVTYRRLNFFVLGGTLGVRPDPRTFGLMFGAKF
ncbi:MAG TPA: TonB-dependent receptor [Sphingobium sp.]|nr:TonB-dependent receptor [Sphingobium sp.]